MKIISEILGMIFYILMIPIILIVTLFVIIFGKELILNNESKEDKEIFKTGVHYND